MSLLLLLLLSLLDLLFLCSSAVKVSTCQQESRKEGTDVSLHSTICQPSLDSEIDINTYNKKNCPQGIDSSPTWLPGDVDKTFERILTLQQYNPKVYSHGNENGTWVVSLDDFISKDDAEYLRHHVENVYEVASAKRQRFGFIDAKGNFISKSKFKGPATDRKMACSGDNCIRDEKYLEYTRHMSFVTGMPLSRFENHRYTVYLDGGVGTSVHRDGMNKEKTVTRLVSVLVYLNDDFDGGDTIFPLLNLKIQPKAGRMVMWSIVQDSDPGHVFVST